MKIVWNSGKAAANPKIHAGVTFEEAQSVLFDPFALTREDDDAEGEQRFVSLGMGGQEQDFGRSLHLSQRDDPTHLGLESERVTTEAL